MRLLGPGRAEAPSAGAARSHHATSWPEARSLAAAAGRDLRATRAGANGATEMVALRDAADRTLAVDLVAGSHLPGFDSSAMDGWIVAGSGPWRVGAAILAGDAEPAHPLLPGQARPIATGGVVPRGATAVVRAEDGTITMEADGAVLHTTESSRGDIRLAGEEALRGEVLLRAGTVLSAPRLALAAVAGYDEVEVVRAITVALVVCGDEVRDAGRVPAGQVRDVFTPSLPQAVRNSGGHLVGARHCSDDLDATVSAIVSAQGELIVTSGGTSRGPADFARAALRQLGARILFDGVAVRPGHPVILAVLPDGRPVLCLPGNPLAGLLCFAGFAPPILDAALGRAPRRPGVVPLALGIDNPSRSTRLVPCRIDDGGDATPTPWTGPGMLRGLALADAVVIVPPGGLAAGAPAAVLDLPW